MENFDRTARIRDLNQKLRTTFTGGRIMLTPGITALPEATQRAILHAIATFDKFNNGNNPHGENDFGSVEIDSKTVFFKIDYYAPGLEYGSEDPADPAKTVRVLTVMLSEEY